MSKPPRLRYFSVVLALLFGLGVILFSIVPVDRVKLGTRPPSFAAPTEVHQAARIHFLTHVLVFGAVAAAAATAAESMTASAAGESYATLIAFSFTMLLGFASEYFQHLSYRINLEAVDVLTNLASITAVFSLVVLLFRLQRDSK